MISIDAVSSTELLIVISLVLLVVCIWLVLINRDKAAICLFIMYALLASLFKDYFGL